MRKHHDLSKMTGPLEDYVAAHNECVRTGRCERLTALFAEDASMVFASGRAGPFNGREAIAEAFRTAPPTDTLEVTDVLWSDESSALARYRWSRGESEGGRLYVARRDRLVTLVIVLPDC